MLCSQTRVIDRDQRFPKGFPTEITQDLGLRSSEAIGCTCDVLPQVASISQMGVSTRGLQFGCSVGFVSSGSQHHQLARCVFCLKENLGRAFEILFLLASFDIFCSLPCSVTPTSPLVFRSIPFVCLSF